MQFYFGLNFSFYLTLERHHHQAYLRPKKTTKHLNLDKGLGLTFL